MPRTPASYVHEGDVVDYTPSSAVTAGAVVVQGDLVGVAVVDIPANTLGSLAVAGVFDVAKATGGSTARTAGQLQYWDATNQVAVTSASGNKLLGPAVQAAADGDAIVRIRLKQ